MLKPDKQLEYKTRYIHPRNPFKTATHRVEITGF